MRNLAVIPARGGSKRILRKNIREFLGKPIIAYSIESALQCDFFTKVMVSTEDKEIASVAEDLGAEIPFFRSDKTASDHATLGDVVFEVIQEFENQHVFFDHICCLLPTAPFVNSSLLTKGYRLLNQQECDSIVTVCKYPSSIYRAKKMKNGYLQDIFPENRSKRSQDLEDAFYDAGQFYWVKSEVFLDERRLSAGKSLPLLLNSLHTQDIDTEEDWQLAEIKYRISNDLP